MKENNLLNKAKILLLLFQSILYGFIYHFAFVFYTVINAAFLQKIHNSSKCNQCINQSDITIYYL